MSSSTWASSLSVETLEALSDVPWAEMIATRHVLVHETDSVDYSKIWNAVQDLPHIRRVISARLA